MAEQKNVQDPRALIDNIGARLALLSHTLQRTQPQQITEELLTGFTQIVEDIQEDFVPLVEFCEDKGQDCMVTSMVTSDNTPFDELGSSEAKLTVIQHSINYGQENLGEDEICAFATMIDEVRTNLKNVTAYCQEADSIVSPLKRNLRAVHPESPGLLDDLWMIDSDGKIQQRFIRELYKAKPNCKPPLASMM